MSWDRWHHDPREGEWPEPMALCPHEVDLNEAECGRCVEERRRELAMAQMTDEMLRKVEAR